MHTDNSGHQTFLGFADPVHCKNIWVTSTIFRSSQLHACCDICDVLQTSKDASNLIQTLSVVEKLLLFVNIRILLKALAIWVHSWHFYHNHATKELLQGQMSKIRETPNLTRNADL